ncbi:MAG: peptidoglycan DD-metalloendopeptidase family protein [Eubacterium sp.]|nr:peptidoglycan DD-metalloendopeptidase family protein [Eubacterium sp.]
MGYKNKKLLSAILIGTMIAGTIQAIPVNNSVVFADELSDAEEKKAEAQSKREEAEYKLSQLETAKKDILEVIEALDTEISGYQTKIYDLRDEKNRLQVSAAVIENNLQNAYIAESKQYESMKERIQFAYENGDADYIEALLSIKEYSAVTNQAEYVDKVSVFDQHQLNDLLEIEKSIAELKATISDNLKEVSSLKAEAEGEQEALQVMQNGKQSTLSEYNIEIADQQITIEEMEALEAEQDQAIAAIEANAAAARAAALAASRASNDTSSPTDADDGSDYDVPDTLNSYSGGAFTWPLPGCYTLTDTFGPREVPTPGASSFHHGVDIAGDEGLPIVAAADGVVSFTGYFGAGGNTVIIDHGDGMSTLYMHMSAFGISEGANVTAGTVIGYVGSTGASTGPHLHFGIRIGGEYYDPLGYL